MSTPQDISRSDLIHAVGQSIMSAEAKSRTITAIESTSSTSFTPLTNSKQRILTLYARRLARVRPVLVEGEETFLADIGTVTSDRLVVVSITRGELHTSIWMDGLTQQVVATLTAMSKKGWETAEIGADSASLRTVTRPNEVLRLFGPDDDSLPGEAGQLAVEWGGVIGHPTSYGLLGGFVLPGDGPAIVSAPSLGEIEFDSLPRYETVTFELLEDYRLGVETLPLRITVAAHGYASSSRITFKWLGRMLAQTEGGRWPDDEARVWEMWDRARAEEIHRPR